MSLLRNSNLFLIEKFIRFRQIHTPSFLWVKSATKCVTDQDQIQQKSDDCNPNAKECKISMNQPSIKEKQETIKTEDKTELESSLSIEQQLDAIRVKTDSESDFSNVKVVIVGAGIAGISAARYFEENGIKNYTVLEALGRPGGRIHSDWFGDAVIEYGTDCLKPASEDINLFLQAAIQDGLIESPITYSSLFRGEDCRHISSPISLAAYELFKKIYCEVYHTGGDILQHFSFRVDQELELFPDHLKDDVARIMIGLLAVMYRRHGDNLPLIHRSKDGTHLQIPNGRIRLSLGMNGILSPILRAIPKGKIVYNKPVQNIRWGAVECENTPRVQIKCCDGTMFPADYVLVTVSLGVLKHMASTLFCPALPSSTMDAINKIGYQHKDHIFVKFKNPHWMWYQHIDTIPERNGELEKNFGESSWLRSVTKIKPVFGSETLLQVVVDGPFAQHSEKHDPLDLASDLKKYLSIALGMRNLPPITDVRRSEWSSNIYFNGAYPTGATAELHAQLASSLPGNNAPVSPMIFFAGDATTPKPLNLVQGAKISGLREAVQIHELIKTSLTSQIRKAGICN
ncbi:protein anon-37Cs [Nilaparvata lugens]|uniref:protein anon-37Cs n=1 Tax=Nilaparvata lugens TaxID=108931 RepID=UPI00193E61C4|nr:protein anon-37Cs [Nilaparvata lugens]